MGGLLQGNPKDFLPHLIGQNCHVTYPILREAEGVRVWVILTETGYPSVMKRRGMNASS